MPLDTEGQVVDINRADGKTPFESKSPPRNDQVISRRKMREYSEKMLDMAAEIEKELTGKVEKPHEMRKRLAREMNEELKAMGFGFRRRCELIGTVYFVAPDTVKRWLSDEDKGWTVVRASDS